MVLELAKRRRKRATMHDNEITVPEVPSDLWAESSPFALQLNWNDNSSNETGFRIYRREFSDPYALFAEIGPDETTYGDGSVEMGILYSYYVVAFNEAGESAPSEVLEIEFTGE